MKIGFVGLGKMGSNMVRNLLEKGHDVVVYDQKTSIVKELMQDDALGATSLPEVASLLQRPRVIWLMVPAGPIVDDVVDGLYPHV